MGLAPSAYAAQLVVLPSIPFYGIICFAALRVERNTLRNVLIGVVDPIRASLFAIVLGCCAVVVEMFLLVTLFALHARLPSKQVDPMSAGIAFGLFMLVVVAPVVEEFLVQGWVQTIARPFGPRAAGVVATLVFVVLHAPRTLFELVRAGGLGAAAWLRGWTRCLAACIIVHATMNGIFGLVMAAGLHR
jgi:membrane protease YdiL (CAAX protease family)